MCRNSSPKDSCFIWHTIPPRSVALAILSTLCYNILRMQEAIPAGLLLGSRKDEFLIWLRALAIPREDKKLVLLFWADKVRTKVTAEMLARAGIK